MLYEVITDGMEEVRAGRYADYVELTKDGIELYSNSFITLEHQILQGTLTAFTEKYKVISTIAKLEPDKIGVVGSEPAAQNYIKETSLIPDRKPGALDYYAMAMTALVALWGAMSAGQLIVITSYSIHYTKLYDGTDCASLLRSGSG